MTINRGTNADEGKYFSTIFRSAIAAIRETEARVHERHF